MIAISPDWNGLPWVAFKGATVIDLRLLTWAISFFNYLSTVKAYFLRFENKLNIKILLGARFIFWFR